MPPVLAPHSDTHKSRTVVVVADLLLGSARSRVSHVWSTFSKSWFEFGLADVETGTDGVNTEEHTMERRDGGGVVEREARPHRGGAEP